MKSSSARFTNLMDVHIPHTSPSLECGISAVSRFQSTEFRPIPTLLPRRYVPFPPRRKWGFRRPQSPHLMLGQRVLITYSVLSTVPCASDAFMTFRSCPPASRFLIAVPAPSSPTALNCVLKSVCPHEAAQSLATAPHRFSTSTFRTQSKILLTT